MVSSCFAMRFWSLSSCRMRLLSLYLQTLYLSLELIRIVVKLWLWMTQMVGAALSGITALSPLENWPLRIVKCALNMYRPDRESERFPTLINS